MCMCGMCIHTCTYLHEHRHPSDYCQQKRYQEKQGITKKTHKGWKGSKDTLKPVSLK